MRSSGLELVIASLCEAQAIILTQLKFVFVPHSGTQVLILVKLKFIIHIENHLTHVLTHRRLRISSDTLFKEVVLGL